MTATHDTYVKDFTAAGQRMHRGECRTCPWFGVKTTDKTTASIEADRHGIVGTLRRRTP